MLGSKGRQAWRIGALVACISATTVGQSPDNMVLIVDSSTATGGASVGCFAYNPLTDSMFVAGYGSGGELRRVDNVSTSQSSELMVSGTEWTLFHLDGNPDYTGGQFIPNGMVLNPQPIYDADGTTLVFPAYSQAWLVDIVALVRQQPEGILRNDLLHRVYRYNLQQVQLAPDPLPDPPPYYDGRDVFTSLVTRPDLQQAANATSTVDNMGRQPAWSSDGQWLYCLSSSTYGIGGIWKINPVTGALNRIYEDALNNEPAVVHTSQYDLDPANPVEGDQIVMCGTTASGNQGALDYVIDDGTVAHGPYPLFTIEEFLRFIEWNGYDSPRLALLDGTDPLVNTPATLDSPYSTVMDGDHNFYFFQKTQAWVWRYDPQGRFAGMKSKQLHLKWNVANGSSDNGGSTLRMTIRDVTYGNAPGQFTVPQIMFQSVDLKAIGGLYAFKPGDFNRDNVVDAADLALFRAALAIPVGTFSRIPTSGTYKDKLVYYEAPADAGGGELELTDSVAYVNYLKCDLNNNNLVTGKDSLILWRFMGYAPVDYDMDHDVDQADFGHFQRCWSGSRLQRDPLCADADLDNNEYVDLADLDLFNGCASGPGIPADVHCLD